jgi:ubiquinone/menaquinone biosynthesis C-methylase UbiE
MEMDVQKYRKIEKGIFAPVYPAIARQIVEKTGIRSGVCVDIGCGGGSLGASLAEITDLFIRFFDENAGMLDLVGETMAERGLSGRHDIIQGDVAAMKIPDGSVNLAVSRGSVFFWEDLPGAFREIYRILAPGGWSWIGGGFGSREIRESIVAQMEARQDADRESFRDKMKRNLGKDSEARFETALKDAGVTSFTIDSSEDWGLWIIMRK